MNGTYAGDAGGDTVSAGGDELRPLVGDGEEGFFLLDGKTGVFIECSEEAARILGHAPGTLIGKSLRDLVAGGARAVFDRTVMARARDRGCSGHVRVECTRGDGETRVVEIVLFSRGRGRTGGTIRDVSAVVESMKRLRENEERFASFVTTSCYGYAETDTEGNIVFVNDRLLEMFHFRREDILGRSFSLFTNGSERVAALRDFELVFSAPNAGPREHVIIDGRGERRVCEINSIPLRRDGKIVGTQTTVLDVTERVLAQEREREHLETLDFLFRSAMDFWRMDSLGESCRYIAEKIVEIFDGNAAVRVFSCDSSSRLLKQEAAAGHGGRWEEAESGMEIPGALFSAPRGRLVECSPAVPFEEGSGTKVYGITLGMAEVPAGVIFIVPRGDIASRASAAVEAFVRQASVACEKWKAIEEKRKLYEQLLQAQKMEAVGALSGGIAHDINNVLTAITGYCDIILPRLSRHPFLRENVEGIKKCVERAGATTRQLLAFGRRQIMKPRVCSMNGIIEDVAMMLRRLIGEDVRLVLDLDGSVQPVNVDRVQVEQVILNLAVNARDAMPDGGEITISTREETLGEERCRVNPEIRPGRYVLVRFADTGTGIKEEMLPHIFEPFFSTKESGRGTGLGLSTVYGIVQQHGGIIEVSSTYGKGTAFSLYFPVATDKEKRSQQYPKKKRKRSRDGEDSAVLIVEDDETVCEVTARLMAENGFRVDTAASAEEATALFRRKRGRFDLVISDMVLPGKNGLQLVEELFTMKPNLPVILCSGYSDDRSLRRKIAERKIFFLHKPYDLDDMLDLVRRLL